MNFAMLLSRLSQPALVALCVFLPLAVKAEPTGSAPATSLPATFSTLSTNNINDPNVPGQVTSVSQLSDVQPTDWAFQALQSLVERYGCIAGYPDGTFRGNRAATRYELAAALNACLDQISDRFATKEDLETVKQLQEEFKAELATLKGRVDGLEARTSTIEAQMFSTTTKLNAEVIFAGAEAFTTNDKQVVATGDPSVPLNARFFSGDRVRLNFDTSFTGRDRLRIRLQANNIANLSGVTQTNMGRLGFDGSSTNNFVLDDLWYKFPIGQKANVTVIANSGEFNDFVGSNFNPYLESSAGGALSRFGRFNPIYRFGSNTNSAGAILNYKFNDRFAATIGYLADNPFTSVVPPGGNGGLFGGSYSALAQLEYYPSKKLGIGLTYVHAFQEPGLVNLTGSTGSRFAANPFSTAVLNGAESNSGGLEFTWKAAKWLNISGWGGITFAESTVDNKPATILNWAVALAFPDLLIPGNVGAIIVGQEPTYISGTSGTQTISCNATLGGIDVGKANLIPECDRNFHIEALYKIKINGNITVTPGLIVLLNPENNNNNGTEFVPVIRTTFKF